MSGFRTGNFDRERAPRILRHLTPIQAVDSILEVDLTDLQNAGKKLILLDVDNTLLEWRSEEIPETTHTWVKEARKLGFDLCILSNTRNPERLKRLADSMGLEFLLGKFKPSRHMFFQALDKFKVPAEDAIMIGDQMFTDVLGANRSGIDAILVRQMAPHEFLGTKINRFGERIIRSRIHRAIQADGQELVGGAAAFDLLSNPTVRQFVKFCIVGGSSTVIDVGLHYLLMFLIPWHGELLSKTLGTWLIDHGGFLSGFFQYFATRPEGNIDPAYAASPVFKIFTTSIAIFNSFVWNRSWTFGITTKEKRASQMRKFYVVAITGAILNTIMLTFFGNVIPGHAKRSWAIASAIATVLVAVWNFLGQKLWTFREKHPEVKAEDGS